MRALQRAQQGAFITRRLARGGWGVSRANKHRQTVAVFRVIPPPLVIFSFTNTTGEDTSQPAVQEPRSRQSWQGPLDCLPCPRGSGALHVSPWDYHHLRGPVRLSSSPPEESELPG